MRFTRLLCLDLFFDVRKALFYHPPISAFVKQAAELLPGIPPEFEIDVPLQSIDVTTAMGVKVPAIEQAVFPRTTDGSRYECVGN